MMRPVRFVTQLLPLLFVVASLAASGLPPQVRFKLGPVNSVTVGADTAVYSAPQPGMTIHRLLLTHARRNAIGNIPEGAMVIVPAAEQSLFTKPEQFWTALESGRFHDYAQRSTRVPILPLRRVQSLADNAQLSLGKALVRVIDTPGYTPGAVSYVIDSGGKRVICTGDLIYGDGKIFDLYSLQDAVPEAKARGYHGYSARAGELIASLRKVAALKPDLLLPAHGPAIDNPQQAISLLIDRLQGFLKSHFETDALRWYWGDENHRLRARAVERTLDVMPMAEQAKLPPDIQAIGNSRLILSPSGGAFLVDAGYNKLLPELERLKAAGQFATLDGLWITHYHDDHTDYINDVVRAFHPPVYFTRLMSEVMGNPGAFRLPCLTTQSVSTEHAVVDRATLRWHEWQFTFWQFPGQTLYHGGLVARRDDGQTYFFAGDSFTPSGMDDYCMQNRDFLRTGAGYEFCLRRIAGLPPDTWILNQHVEPMFRFTAAQLARMQNELAKRSAQLSDLSPWPDINYMLDESWARAYPYAQTAAAGEIVTLALRITNHASNAVTYRANWNVPAQWKPFEARHAITIPAMAEGQLEARFRAAGSGLHVVTADLSFGSWQLPAWTEALVRIQ